MLLQFQESMQFLQRDKINNENLEKKTKWPKISAIFQERKTNR
jgi:hypothetical protein